MWGSVWLLGMSSITKKKIIFVSLSILFSILMVVSLNVPNNFFLKGYFFDDLSLSLMLLSFLIVILCVLLKSLDFFLMNVNFWLLILLSVLFGGFLSNSVLLFFMFFELSMLPMLFLMLGWGTQPERLLAGSYLFLYTFLGSLPLLLKILYFSSKIGSTKYFMKLQMSSGMNLKMKILHFFLFMGWFLAFLMKLPVFGLHHWLPKAHVEASTMGSMILAGILLKLGCYGLLRLENFFLLKKKSMFKVSFFWIFGGLLILNLVCFRQQDLKSMVAYSSVIHMSLIYLSLFKFKKNSFLGSMLMMMSHGFMSSGMFLTVGNLYSLSGSRSILSKKGWFFYSGVLIFLFFFFCILKMAFPPFLSFLGELYMFSSLSVYHVYTLGVMLLNMFLVGLYKMYLYSLISHGKGFLYLKNQSFNLYLKLNLVFHLMLSLMLLLVLDSFC